MAEQSKDIGVFVALAKRMVEQRLPKALSLKEKVGRGELLDDFDIAFLEEVLEGARSIGTLLDKHPEYHDIAARMMRLYNEITAKALENEQSRQ